MTRQQRYQIKHRERGLCVLYARPAVTAWHCEIHAVRSREQQRRQRHCKKRYVHARSYSFKTTNKKGQPRA